MFDRRTAISLDDLMNPGQIKIYGKHLKITGRGIEG